jgi:hypothetical protein
MAKLGKLIGYDLNAGSFGGNLLPKSPIVSFNSGNINDNDYEDISSMENWDFVDVLDWSRRRDQINPLFYAIANANLTTYGNLTDAQKLIGAKYFFVPYSLRVSNGIVTEQQDLDNWYLLLNETKESRLSCIEAMRKHVGQYIRTSLLTLAQTQSFYKDLYQYIDWFQQANAPDFKQWIFGLVPYAGIFASKDYYSTNLQNELIDIYNGNY